MPKINARRKRIRFEICIGKQEIVKICNMSAVENMAPSVNLNEYCLK